MLNNHDRIGTGRLTAGGRQAGITLIETLVAVLVLGIGLLGVASMQSTGLRMTDSAQMRSQATILAQDIVERMRVNPGAFNSGGVPGNLYHVPGGAAAAGGSGNYNACYTDSVPSGGGCQNPGTMASADLYAWSQLLAQRLPEGEGVVCLDSDPQDGNAPAAAGGAGCDNTPGNWAIKIWWRDRDDNTRTLFTTKVEGL